MLYSSQWVFLYHAHTMSVCLCINRLDVYTILDLVYQPQEQAQEQAVTSLWGSEQTNAHISEQWSEN